MANEYTGYSGDQRRFKKYDREPSLKKPELNIGLVKHRQELDELYTISNDPYSSWRLKRNSIRRRVKSTIPDISDTELELIYDQYNLGQAANPKDFSRDKDFGGTVSRWGSLVGNIGEMVLGEGSNFIIAKHVTGDPEGMLQSQENMEELSYENELIHSYQSKDMNPVTQFLFDLSVSAPTMVGMMIGGTAVGGAVKAGAAAVGIGGVAAWIAGTLGFNAVEGLMEAGFNYTNIISDPMVVQKIEDALKRKMTDKDADEIRLRALEILSDRAGESAEKVFIGNFFNPLNLAHTFGAGRLAKLIKVASGRWGTSARIATRVSGREALEEALQSAGSQYTENEAKMLALKDVGAQVSFPLREGTIYGVDPKQVAYEALMGGFVGGPLGFAQGFRGYTKWQKGAFDLDKRGNPVRKGDPVGRIFANVGVAQPGDPNFIPKGLILHEVRSIIDISDTESALIHLDEYRQRASDQDQRIVNVIDEELHNMRQGADLLGERTVPQRTTNRQERANAFRPGTHSTVDAEIVTPEEAISTDEVAPDVGVGVVDDLNPDPVIRATVEDILNVAEGQRTGHQVAYIRIANKSKELNDKQINQVIKNMEKQGTLPKGGEPRPPTTGGGTVESIIEPPAQVSGMSEIGADGNLVKVASDTEGVGLDLSEEADTGTESGEYIFDPETYHGPGQAAEHAAKKAAEAAKKKEKEDRDAKYKAELSTMEEIEVAREALDEEEAKAREALESTVKEFKKKIGKGSILNQSQSSKEITGLLRTWQKEMEDQGWTELTSGWKIYADKEQHGKNSSALAKYGKKNKLPWDKKDRYSFTPEQILEVARSIAEEQGIMDTTTDVRTTPAPTTKKTRTKKAPTKKKGKGMSQSEMNFLLFGVKTDEHGNIIEEEVVAEEQSEPLPTFRFKNIRLLDEHGNPIGKRPQLTKELLDSLKGKTVLHYYQNSGFKNDNPNSFPKGLKEWRFDGIEAVKSKDGVITEGNIIFSKSNKSAWRMGETVKDSKVIRDYNVNEKTGVHTKDAESMFLHLLSGRADTYSVKVGKAKDGKFKNAFLLKGSTWTDAPLNVAEGTERVGSREPRPTTILDVEEQVHTDALTEGITERRTKSGAFRSPEQVTDEGLAEEAAVRKRTKQEELKDELAARRETKREKAKAKAKQPKAKKGTKAPATTPKGEMATVAENLNEGIGAFGAAIQLIKAEVNAAKKTGRVLEVDDVKNSLPEKFRDEWYAKIKDDPKYTDVSKWNATGKTTEYFASEIKKDLGGIKKAPPKLKDVIRNALTTWLEGEVTPDNIQSLKDRYFPLLTQGQREKVNFALAKKGGATVDTGVKKPKYTAKEQEARDNITEVRKKAKKKREELKKKPQKSEEVAPETVATTEPTLVNAVRATKKVPFKKPTVPNVWQIFTSEAKRIFAPFLSVKDQTKLDTFVESLGSDQAFIVSGGLTGDHNPWKIYRLDTSIDVSADESPLTLTSLKPEGDLAPPFIKNVLHEHGRMLGEDRKANEFFSRKLDKDDLIADDPSRPPPSDILARIDRDVDVNLTELEETVSGMPITWAFGTGKLVELQYMEAAGKGLEPEVVQIEFKDDATAAQYVETIRSKNPDRKKLEQMDDELIDQFTKENTDRSAFGEAQIKTLTGIVQSNAEDHATVYGDSITETDVDVSTDYFDELEAAKGEEKVYTVEEIAEYEGKLKDKIRDGSAIPILAPVSEEAPVEVELERYAGEVITVGVDAKDLAEAGGSLRDIMYQEADQLTEEEVRMAWEKTGETIEEDIKRTQARLRELGDEKSIEMLNDEKNWDAVRVYEFMKEGNMPIELMQATKGIAPLTNEWWDALIKRQAEIGHGWMKTASEPDVIPGTSDVIMRKRRIQPTPVPLPRIKEIVKDFLTKYPGSPLIVVIPEGMMGNLPIAGFFNPETATTYLNQGQIFTEAMLVKSLWHESIGHGTVETLLPAPAKAELVELIKNSFPNDVEFYNKAGKYGDAQKAVYHKHELVRFMRLNPNYRKHLLGELKKLTPNTEEEAEWISLMLNASEAGFQVGFKGKFMPQAHLDFLNRLDGVDLEGANAYHFVKEFAKNYFKKLDNERGAITRSMDEQGLGYAGKRRRYFLFDVENSKLIKATDTFAETQVSLEIVARIAESLGHPEGFKGGQYEEALTAHYAADPTLRDKIVFWFRKVFGNFLQSLGFKPKTISLGEVKLGLLDLASNWGKEKGQDFRGWNKAKTKEGILERADVTGEEAIGFSFDVFEESELKPEHRTVIRGQIDERVEAGNLLKKVLPHEKFKNMGDLGAEQLEAMDAMYPTYDPKETTASSWWSRFKARAFHDVFDPHAVVKEKIGMVPYMKQRLANREDGVMAVLLRHGLVKVKQVVADGIKINETHFDGTGKGLFNVMRVFGGNKSEIDRFVAFAAYSRADYLEKEIGEEALGITRENIDRAINPTTGFDQGLMFDATTKVMTSRKRVYAQVGKDLAAWNKNIVDLGINLGLFNEESASNWRTDWYLPFFRHFEDEIGKDVPKGTRNYKSLAGQAGIKQLKGSKRALDNPLDNLVRNALHIVSASLKNDAAVLTLEQAEKIKDPITGEFLAKRTKHPGQSSLRVIKDGKDVHYNISNELLYKSLGQLNVTNDFSGLKWAIGAKNLFTRITTASPLFKKRNILRDTMQAAALSDVGFNVWKNAVGGWKEVGKSEAELLVAGAYIQFGNLRSDDPNYAQKLLTKDMRSGFIGMNPEAHDGYKNAVKKYAQAARSVWDRYQKWGDKAENANRASIYRSHMNKGEGQTKAAYEAKDLHDFTLHGGARWVNLVTSITPFANAMLQGKYKMGRQLVNNPKPVIIVGSAIVLASLAEYFMYEDNEEWQRRQDWDKDMFWWINIPGTDVHYRMPKPHELNIVANLAWRGLDMARKKDPVHGELFVSAIKSVVGREFDIGGPFPKIISPFIEVGFNENFFFDRPIEPYRFKNMSPKEKRDLYTSETMIRMSEAFDWTGVEVSPMQLSHLVNGYFGWVGEQVIAMSDFVVSKDKDFPVRPASKIIEHNLLRKMFQASPIRNTKAGTAFYERMGEIEQAYNDMQLSKKLEDWDRYEEIYEEKKDLLKWRDFIKKKQRIFNELNKRIRVIRFDRSMSADNKRVRIDQLYALRNQIMDKIAGSPALR